MTELMDKVRSQSKSKNLTGILLTKVVFTSLEPLIASAPPQALLWVLYRCQAVSQVLPGELILSF